MRIQSVEIEGYRSIREPIKLVFDHNVTVVLGANDHGKTNFLEAILHLNEDSIFDEENDLNWDCQGSEDKFPRTKFSLLLDDSDKADLRSHVTKTQVSRATDAMLVAEKEIVQNARAEFDSLRAELSDLTSKLTKAEQELFNKKTALESSPNDQNLHSEISSATKTISNLKREQEKAQKNCEKAEVKLGTSKRDEMAVIALNYEAHGAVLNENAGVNYFSLWLDKISSDLKNAKAIQADTQERRKEKSKELENLKSSGSADASVIQKSENKLIHAQRKENVANKRLEHCQKEHSISIEVKRFVESDEYKNFQVPMPKSEDIEISDEVVIERVGLRGKLDVNYLVDADEDLYKTFLLGRVPRVELIKPIDKLPDSASGKVIGTDAQSFMRGIFYYAGLIRGDWDGIFEQTDVTTKRLRQASDRLNQTLKENWSQGKELIFRLAHNSGTQEIELRIEDPAVKERDVRASRRSRGFTHFFALKTILKAREKEAPATSYIWLFDEPGLHLHPSGQHDLIQALESLSRSNQVVYSTHSIFMINKNFPTRHQLLTKDKRGTRIDSKPYLGHWKSAINALGLSLPGNILFANHVLLVEGDSDPILVNAMLQELIRVDKFDSDINSFAAISTGNSRNLDALLRILTEGTVKPTIAALFDGDDGGKKRMKNTKKIMEELEIRYKNLPDKTTIEDHIPYADVLFLRATAKYLCNITTTCKIETAESELQKAFVEKFGSDSKLVLTDLANLFREESRRIGNLDEPPSSVGVAREYSNLLRKLENDRQSSRIGTTRSEELARWIATTLGLPKRVMDSEKIVDD